MENKYLNLFKWILALNDFNNRNQLWWSFYTKSDDDLDDDAVSDGRGGWWSCEWCWLADGDALSDLDEVDGDALSDGDEVDGGAVSVVDERMLMRWVLLWIEFCIMAGRKGLVVRL